MYPQDKKSWSTLESLMVGRRCFPVEIVPFKLTSRGVRCPNGEGMVKQIHSEKKKKNNTLGAIERVKFHHGDFVGIMFPCDYFVGKIKQTWCHMLQVKFPGISHQKQCHLFGLVSWHFMTPVMTLQTWWFKKSEKKSSWGTCKKTWIILGGVELLIDQKARYTKQHFVSLGSFP